MQRVNYDAIAEGYDEPLRDHSVDPNLIEFLEEFRGIAHADTPILDVGCGTGKQLAANKAQFPGLPMTGLDLFRGMLTIARKRRPDISWVHGDGAALPFRGDSFVYACNQFSYPHVREKEKMFREIWRVLRPGGRFVLTNIDPWSMPDWIVYRFFPTARELDYNDFLPADTLGSLFEDTGFIRVRVHHRHWVNRQELGEFLRYAMQRHRTSQFMAIPDKDYLSGIEQLKHTCADARENELVVDSGFCLVTVRGDKP